MTIVSRPDAEAQADEIKLDLAINDKSLPKRVFAGKNSEHPADVPFTVLAVP